MSLGDREYLGRTIPLYLSILTTFAVPIVETLAIGLYERDFLTVLGLAIPLTNIVATGTRLYAQSDVFAAPPGGNYSASLLRTIAASLVLLIGSVLAFEIFVAGRAIPHTWHLATLLFLVSSAIHAPRVVGQCISTLPGSQRSMLLPTVVMGGTVIVLATAVVWLFGRHELFVVFVVLSSLLAVLSSGAATFREFRRRLLPMVSWKGAFATADMRIVKTIVFSMTEVLAYNACAILLFANLARDGGPAAVFSLVGSISLASLAWRVTFSVQFQERMTALLSQRGADRQTVSVLFARHVALCLLHAVGFQFVIFLLLIALLDTPLDWPVFATALAINVFGAFNQMALAGLRSTHRMRNGTLASVAVNATAAAAVILLDLSGYQVLVIYCLDEFLRSTANSTLLLVRASGSNATPQPLQGTTQ